MLGLIEMELTYLDKKVIDGEGLVRPALLTLGGSNGETQSLNPFLVNLPFGETHVRRSNVSSHHLELCPVLFINEKLVRLIVKLAH